MSPSSDDAWSSREDGGRRPRARRRSGGAEGPQYLAGGLLAATVVVSVLAIGAVHLPVMVVVAALGFAAAAVAMSRQAQGHDGIVVPLPTLVCLALAGYTLLQIVPLPIHWLSTLSHTTADIWGRSLLPFGEGAPRWASISLDPGASAVEALKWATYGAVFAAAAAVSARHGASPGLYVVHAAAVLAALVTLGHGLTDATRVYGLYQPTFGAVSWHVGPLLNPNNLAGYLNLGAIVGLGLMLADRPHAPRWLLGLGVAVVVGIGLTSASRAGTACLLVGVVALALHLRGRHENRRGHRPWWTWATLLGVVAAGVVMALLGGTQKTWDELYDKDLSKLTMFLWVKPMVRDFPFFGVGRGAFETVFPVYRTVPGNQVFTHPENFVAQWVTEWGVPVAAAALGIFAWAFGPRRLGASRSAVAAGAICGVGVLLLQNLVDLGLEIPAVSAAVAATLGSLWGDRHRSRTREALRRPEPLSPRAAQQLAIGVGGAGVAFASLAIALGVHDIDAERRAVHETVTHLQPGDTPPPAAEIDAARRQLHAAMRRHPADPYFPLIGATLAVLGKTAEGPIPWLQRSLERAQVNGRAHLLLAEVLASRGKHAQALLELRLAVTDDPAVVPASGALLAHWVKAYEDLSPAVPAGKLGASVLISVAGAALNDVKPPKIELARRTFREAVAHAPDEVGPRVEDASFLIDSLAASGPACADRAACRAFIVEDLAVLDRMRRHDGGGTQTPDGSGPMLRARFLAVEGQPEEALGVLRGVCEELTDRAPCLTVRATVAARIKSPAALETASRDLLATTCLTSPLRCADNAAWLANLRLSRGDIGSAISHLERAAREDPGNEARWLQLADTAVRGNQHGLAFQSLERVAKLRGGADPDLRRRMDGELGRAQGALYAPR